MEFNRTTNAKRTIVSGIAIKSFSIIAPFFMRTLIIYSLGNLYLGLNSLFTSILNALNLAELGVGSAMTFAMYKPVADDNREEVAALLNAYRIIYYAIGIVVLTAGLAITPFIPEMIHGDYPEGINIYIIYLLQLTATAVGYFFMAYRASIFQVYQRIDIINTVSIVTDILTYAIQAIALMKFRNFYLYTAALVFRAVGHNLLIAFLVSKKFPDIKPVGKIAQSTKRMILRKTGALFGHKTGGVVVNSIDNILLSAIIGLNIVAIYNNYFYIITALSGLFLTLTNGLTPIVGNYIIRKDNSEICRLFNVFQYLIAFAVCYCCTCLLNMLQPFMSVWVGASSQLPFSSVVLFTVYFFIVRIKTAGLLFKDAAGLWEKDFLKPYIQIVIDLVLDLILLRTIGTNGAIISSIVCMLFGFFYETVIVFRYCFKISPKRYYISTALYLGATALAGIVSLLICRMNTSENGIVILLFNFMISSVASILIFFICTFWTADFSDALGFIRLQILGKHEQENERSGS